MRRGGNDSAVFSKVDNFVPEKCHANFGGNYDEGFPKKVCDKCKQRPACQDYTHIYCNCISGKCEGMVRYGRYVLTAGQC